MARAAISLVFVWMLLASSRTFAAGPFGAIHVTLWQGGAFTDDKTGAFSHCSATHPYQGGNLLTLALRPGGEWIIGFGNPSWKMTQGESVPLDITVDGQAQFHLTGTASPVQVISILPVAVLNRLRKSSLMAVTGGSQTLQFALYSLDKIIPVIANCVDKVKSHGLASAGDFSIPPPKPPISATAARSTPDDAPPAKPQKLIRVNGTGFVISANGYVVTNNHVIGQCVGDVHGNLTSETAGNMRIVSKDETNDLALLQASGSFKQTAIIRGQPAHPGDSVIAIGYPFHG